MNEDRLAMSIMIHDMYIPRYFFFCLGTCIYVPMGIFCVGFLGLKGRSADLRIRDELHGHGDDSDFIHICVARTRTYRCMWMKSAPAELVYLHVHSPQTHSALAVFKKRYAARLFFIPIIFELSDHERTHI